MYHGVYLLFIVLLITFRYSDHQRVWLVDSSAQFVFDDWLFWLYMLQMIGCFRPVCCWWLVVWEYEEESCSGEDTAWESWIWYEWSRHSRSLRYRRAWSTIIISELYASHHQCSYFTLCWNDLPNRIEWFPKVSESILCLNLLIAITL